MGDQGKRAAAFENQSPLKGILSMAVPTVISQMIAVVYNYADTIFIGRLNDPNQSAAIALALPLTLLITAISNFWGIGGGSMVSRAMGRKAPEEAKRASAFSFWGASVLTLLLVLAAALLGEHFYLLLGASPSDLPYASRYLFWIFTVGALPSVLSQVLAHFARSQGFAREAGLGLTLGGVANLFLDPVFIFPFGLNLGVAGAAIATALSNVISLVYFILLFYRHRKEWNVSFSASNALPRREIAPTVMAVGLPSALIPLLSAVSNGVLNNLIATHGSVAVAAVGIAKKMDVLPANIAAGITQGALPLIAYSYGAGEQEKTKKLIYTAAALAFGSTALVVILLEIFAYPASRIFIGDAETVEYAAQFIRRLCVSIPLYSVTVAINSFFQAVNRPRHAFFLSILRKGIFDVPLMFLFHALFPVAALLWVQPIMDAITCAISLTVLIRFHRHPPANTK